MIKKTAAVLSGAAIAATAVAMPMATASAGETPVQLAQCNPCAAVNPCNPCAAACNPCNPCAGANPCNPCAGACNPCNPCAVNPCNPCAAG